MRLDLLPEETVTLLARTPAVDALELACKADLGVWAERRRGFTHSKVHWEWNQLAMIKRRLAVVAPREHAKSETFTVNQIAWRCIYQPGIWCYVFSDTGDQGKKIKTRIDAAIAEAAPWMLDKMISSNTEESIYANFSTVNTAGAGKGTRGVHPDIVVGDDVLTEGTTLTSLQRKRIERWWFGTVGGMAHPGTTRVLGKSGLRIAFPPTKVHLVGTPFHSQDLLMNMRSNPLYEFRRYAAEFAERDLVPGTMAVEVA